MTNIPNSNDIETLKKSVRIITDFPKPGIVFHDITPVLQNPTTFKILIDTFVNHYKNQPIDLIVAVESRGFIIGSALAYALNTGLALIRKKNKLPGKTISQKYQLEYAASEIEIHCDAIQKNQLVVLVDDLIATGNTILASVKLIEKLGGQVLEVASFIEFLDLGGNELMQHANIPVFAVYQSYSNIAVAQKS